MVNLPTALLTVGLAASTYLMGSINFSIAIAKIRGKDDPRTGGSRNAGATNMARVSGWQWGLLVLVLDLSRACSVIWGAKAVGINELAPAMTLPLLLGNLYPVFHRFHGGKGVAAAVGAMLAISPPTMLCGGGVFLLTLAISRRVSISSIAMCLTYPIWFAAFPSTSTELVTAATIAAVVLVTHRHNISRTFRGEEPRVGMRGSTQAPERGTHQ